MASSPASALSSDQLPEWDLSDLYTSPDSKALQTDFDTLDKKTAEFAKGYEGKVEGLTAEVLAEAIATYETIQDLMGKIGSYAGLLFATKMNDPQVAQFYQNAQEKLTTLASRTLFFTLGINKIDAKKLESMLKDKKLAYYQPWLRDVTALRPYQLSDELEKALLEKQVTGGNAWIRLFDETLTGMVFPIGGKELTEAEAFNLLTDKNEKTRQDAAEVIGEVLKKHSKVFTLITNTLAKDKDIEDGWRGFERPISSRNVANYIENEVVDALIDAARKSFGDLSHRYYKLKASWFGKDALEYWDRNAPLPFENDHTYTWGEAKELVLTSYRAFSDTLADVGQQFFDKPWIDAPVKPGKASGAFAHPVTPSVHPYLLVNFQGKSRDVMTLAHELGHGVHQVLAGKQGTLQSDTPLTLAETASVFGEQLTFQEMLKREQNDEYKKALIAGKVEDMLNTVIRQIAFCQFEIRLHDARKQGELTTEDINKIWMDVQRESLGDAIRLGGNYAYFWSYIPHFIHSPFYVYAYAFGDCLVNSLYAVYTQEKEQGRGDAFEKKYIEMLEAGGTLRHKELLAPFGLDATDPAFWQKGLDVISGFIDKLEE